MSDVNDVFKSLNQLERLIDLNQENVKREIESIINVINNIILLSGRRFDLLKRGIGTLKTSLSSLDRNQQIINQLVLLTQQDNLHNVSDLPGSIRAILSTIAPNKETIDLDASEIGVNIFAESVNILDELGIEGHVNGFETNVPSTSTANDAHFSQSKSANEQANAFELDQATIDENVRWWNSISSSTIPAMIKDFLASSSPKPVSQYFDICKRVKTEDGADTVDSDCECGDCIAEIEAEFKNRNIAQQNAQLQVKKEEVESGEESVIGLEDGDDNQNESLHEHSNGPNQRSVNDNNPIGQQVDNGYHEPNESSIDEYNEPIIDRRFGSLREDVNKLKSPHSALDQINNLLAVLVEQDNQDLGDLSHLIRELKTVTSRQSNDHTSTHDLDASEIGTVESVDKPDELSIEGRVNGIETNSINDGTHLSQMKSANEQANGDSLDPHCSSCQLSIPLCKRVKTEDFDPDCGCAECLFNKKKFETRNNAQLVAQVKKEEVEIGDENDIGLEDDDELNGNQNESLHEHSNGPNQRSVNDNNPIDHVDQQVDNDGDEQNESAIDEYNEPQTSKQSKVSKPRKRKGADKSLVAESEKLLDNSKEVSPPVRRTRSQSKRARVTPPLESETTEQLGTGSEVDSSDEDIPDGDDSSGDGQDDIEQSEDDESLLDDDVEFDDDTEMDDQERGHYKIKEVNLKCIKDKCSVMVANKTELGAHFEAKHHTSRPYPCLANGCTKRFEHWNGQVLDKHCQDEHSDISTWTCPHCTKTRTFQTLKGLYQHLHKFHFEGEFKCGYEGCNHETITTLRYKIRYHQYKDHPKKDRHPVSNKIYKCEDCGKTFNHFGNFNRHRETHTGIRLFHCDWDGCGRSFGRQSTLDRHRLRHQGVKSFKCKVCAMCKGHAATVDYDIIKHVRTQHFCLPASKKEQRERNIQDDRDPYEYLLKATTDESGHNSTD